MGLLTEVDEQPTVALPLIRRQCEYAGDVVVVVGALFLKYIGGKGWLATSFVR